MNEGERALAAVLDRIQVHLFTIETLARDAEPASSRTGARIAAECAEIRQLIGREVREVPC